MPTAALMETIRGTLCISDVGTFECKGQKEKSDHILSLSSSYSFQDNVKLAM